MASRAIQKLQTRRSILDASLAILGQGRSLDSIGLREVTREAGLSAPSFYRHFESMDELGLCLVKEAGVLLREMLEVARKRVKHPNTAIESSVDTFLNYLEHHPTHFRILLQEQVGYSDEFQKAVATEVDNFISELESYLNDRSAELKRPNLDSRNIAEAMVAIVIAMGSKLAISNTNDTKSVRNNTISQLRYVMLGSLSS